MPFGFDAGTPDFGGGGKALILSNPLNVTVGVDKVGAAVMAVGGGVIRGVTDILTIAFPVSISAYACAFSTV